MTLLLGGNFLLIQEALCRFVVFPDQHPMAIDPMRPALLSPSILSSLRAREKCLTRSKIMGLACSDAISGYCPDLQVCGTDGIPEAETLSLQLIPLDGFLCHEFVSLPFELE